MKKVDRYKFGKKKAVQTTYEAKSKVYEYLYTRLENEGENKCIGLLRVWK